MQNPLPSRHPKYRTKLCRNFVSGGCPFGQKCSFLHPPSIDPSSLAPNLFNWNSLLLPQLFALSGQQGILRKMLRRSPPRSQGPQLVDEDPSPTTSLLLSKSDSTSSEQVPQSRRSNRRKKYPCRHFLRTEGWCPAAGQCKLRHDVAALPSGIRKAEPGPPFATDEHREGGRTISGGVLMGVQSPSPPVATQIHSDLSRRTEPEVMESYQPMYWANYAWQPYHAAVPVPATPPSVMQHSICPPPQPQAPSVPPNETQTSLPLGSYEVNGTTYFPTSGPPVFAPPPMPYSLPVQPVSYNPTIAPAYPCYPPAPPPKPAGYYDVAKPRGNGGPQSSTAFDPFASDLMVPRELPVIPQLEDYQISPIPDVPFFLPSDEPEPTNIVGTSGTPTAELQEAFPYQPPKEQRVGHARRISVNIKKHGRVNSR